MKSLSERLQRFSRLPRGERALLAQAWGLFLLVDLALRILPLPRVLALSDRVFRWPKAEAARSPACSSARLAWLVDVAGRYAPAGATCLKRSLVLSWLLRRRGIATTLRIGVARRDGRIEAHAWLERDGQAIQGLPGPDGYAPLVSTRWGHETMG